MNRIKREYDVHILYLRRIAELFLADLAQKEKFFKTSFEKSITTK